ncbi:hypothetical protein Aperf_G00000042814 [Anoplocephala perfoliata]
MATLKEMEPKPNISEDKSSPSREKTKNLALEQNDNEYFLPPLPSVEQMRMDVANATCELQQAFFHQKPNSEHETDWHRLSAETLTPKQCGDGKMDEWKDNKGSELERVEDPRQRTQEETVCEELIINGKKYRHTFQKRVVLESQRTREIFILPASSESNPIEDSPHKENYVSSNFDRYNRVFEDSGARRLDLQVHNQGGDFSPMLVTASHGESPGGPRSPSTGVCQSIEINEQEHVPNSTSATLSLEEPGNSSGIPLGKPAYFFLSHFTAKPNGITQILPTAKQQEQLEPQPRPESFHVYRDSPNAVLKQAKNFTERSSEKRDDVAPGPDAEEQPTHSDAPSPTSENTLRTVANVSDVWKQCARSPLGGDAGTLVISASSLHLCPYNRLQLLQYLCPAAAAAIMILGGQMPEMRSGSCPNQSPKHHVSAVTADAWCPRTLMITEGIEDLLIFSLPDGLEIDSSSPKQNCLLRGGTLDGLLIYALKIFRKNTSDSYESLIPNIFMRLYPTFTTTLEVVNRLIQRYLAFIPIEPGGVGCLEINENEVDFDAQWSEALSILQFLLKLLTRTERELYDSKLETKIVRFAQLLKVDSQIVGQQSSGQKVYVLDESEDENLVCDYRNSSLAVESDPISAELNRISDCLLDLLRIGSTRRGAERPIKGDEFAREDSQICSCQQRLNQFLQLGIKELAEQITAMEEVFFDDIKIYELINVENLEKGKTPTLSRCVQQFNDLNSIVRCLILMANVLGKPMSKTQPKEDDATSVQKEVDSFRTCLFCGLDKRPLVQPDLMQQNHHKISGSVTSPRRSNLKTYLCISPITRTPSMRVRKRNFLLDKTLSHLCDLAETLKNLNNFSSFLAVVLGLQNAPTQSILKKTKMRLNELGAYMLPPNFSAYRRDLEAAKMPCLPYLGLIFQQLIHLDSGNLLFLSSPSEEDGKSPSHNDRGLIAGDEADANKVINFWRCWKHYLILGYFMKKADRDMLDENEKVSYEIEQNLEIQSFLNSFKEYSAKLLQNPHPSSGHSSRRKQRTQSATFNTLP